MSTASWLRGRDASRARDSYLWNSAAGLINALQSTAILFVLQRVSDTNVSGVFTIAFAVANLLQNIGRYGVRYYQASDLEDKYSFGGYVSHRLVTGGLMLLVSMLYCGGKLFFGGYSTEKAAVCLLLCVQKLLDVIEDAFCGEYQRRGMLDVAGRAMSVRLLAVIVSFLAVFCLTRSLVFAAALSTLFGAAVLFLLLRSLRPVFGSPELALRSPAVGGIMRECFPLFAGAFLLMFIINVPKLVIDSLLSSSEQAVYGFISMPVFIVALLAEFFFRPMTTAFTEEWNEGRLAAFRRRLLLVLAVILGITVLCVAGGLTVGIPVLSFLFNYPLRSQWLPLAVLLGGSGVLSMTSFLAMILTLMRRQRCVIFSYIPSAALAVPLCRFFIRRQALLGAALGYLLLVGLMFAVVAGFVLRFLRQRERGNTI